MRITDFCTAHPSSVLLCWLGFALLGICSLCKLEVSFYPEVSIPYAYVVTEFPGMPADEVEKLVTVPLENSISAVKNIRQISSTSKRGESIIRLEFHWDADMQVIGSDLRNKIDAVYPFLPEAVSRPMLSFKKFSDSHIMTLAVFPKSGFSMVQASSLVEKELKSRILALDGIAQVNLTGSAKPEIQVDVNYPLLMSASSLDLQKIAQAVRKSLFRCPIGSIEDGKLCYSVRAETDIKKPGDLCHIPLDIEGAITIGDIASVTLGEKTRNSSFFYDGREGIGLQIIKTGGSSLLKTCSNLRYSVDQLSHVYSNLFDIKIIEDNSKPLAQTILSLADTIGVGIICACIAIMLLLQNRQVALIVILSLPFSLLPLFVCLHCAGISLNIITLSALAIGSGMVFDNAVVVTEMFLQKKTYSSCFPAVIGSTLTTVIIFVPIILLPGLMGKVFSSLAITVILYMTISCAVSLTLTPALFILLKNRICYKQKEFLFERWYKKYLDYMKSKKSTELLLAAAVVLPLLLVFLIPYKTIPEMESESIEIQVSFPYGYPFYIYNKWACELEKKIIRNHLSDEISIFGGYDKESQRDDNIFIFHMKCKDKKNLEKLFDDSPWEHRVLENKNFLTTLVGDDGLYAVTSSERKDLEKEVQLIKRLAGRNGVEAEIVHGLKNNPEYRISVSDNIFSANLTPADIFDGIAWAAEGSIVSQMELDGELVDIRLRYGKEFVDTPEKIASLQFKTNEGVLFMQPFLQLREEHNYFALDRLNRQNAVFLTFSPDTGNGYGANMISDSLAKVNKREIIILFIGALVFIWFVLAVQFGSISIPFIVLYTVPLGISGSLLALFITGKSLNISSVLGLMILAGTGVNSGILILSDVACGISVAQAALSRLRTVCLTLLSTVVALLPVALFDSNPIQRCASISLLGGLLFGTAAIFALVPLFITEDKNG